MIRKRLASIAEYGIAVVTGSLLTFLGWRAFKRVTPETWAELWKEHGPSVIEAMRMRLGQLDRPPFSMPICNDCGEYGHGYMLRDEVWDQIAKPNEMLCLGCAEERLKRPLLASDFVPAEDAPINAPILFVFDQHAEHRHEH